MKVKFIDSKIVVEPEFLDKIRKTYTWVNVDEEIIKMEMWLMVNKAKKNYGRFMINWLNRSKPKPSKNYIEVANNIIKVLRSCGYDKNESYAKLTDSEVKIIKLYGGIQRIGQSKNMSETIRDLVNLMDTEKI